MGIHMIIKANTGIHLLNLHVELVHFEGVLSSQNCSS